MSFGLSSVLDRWNMQRDQGGSCSTISYNNLVYRTSLALRQLGIDQDPMLSAGTRRGDDAFLSTIGSQAPTSFYPTAATPPIELSPDVDDSFAAYELKSGSTILARFITNTSSHDIDVSGDTYKANKFYYDIVQSALDAEFEMTAGELSLVPDDLTIVGYLCSVDNDGKLQGANVSTVTSIAGSCGNGNQGSTSWSGGLPSDNAWFQVDKGGTSYCIGIEMPETNGNPTGTVHFLVELPSSEQNPQAPDGGFLVSAGSSTAGVTTTFGLSGENDPPSNESHCFYLTDS